MEFCTKKYFELFILLAGIRPYNICVVNVLFRLCKCIPPWRKLFFWKLIVPKLVKAFPSFYETRRFITVLTNYTF